MALNLEKSVNSLEKFDRVPLSKSFYMSDFLQ